MTAPRLAAITKHLSAINVLMVACGVMAAAMWIDQLRFEANIFAPYDAVKTFGDDCEYATGVWAQGDSFDAVRARPHVFTRLHMPFRSAERRPALVENGYLITRCRVDLSSLKREGYGWLNLGVVFGPSAVYLNGTLKTQLDEKKFLELPLTPAERVRDAEVVLVSRRDPLYKTAGLASLTPLAYGDSQPQADGLLAIATRQWVELPMARANFCLGLIVIFAVAWWAGIRYGDVGWMIAFLSVLSGINAAEHYIERLHMEWIRTAQVVAYVPLTIAFLAFAVSFLRIPFRQRLVELGLVAATLIYLVLQLTLANTKLINLNTSLRLFWGVSALGLVAVAAAGFRRAGGMPPRRQRRTRVLCVLNVVVAALLLYMFAVIDTRALMIGNTVNIGVAVLFAAFLALDLVVFQHQYFSERTLRERSDGEVRRLQDTLTLGGSIQSLLLPARREDLGAYHIDCRYEPHDSLAGDWYCYWEHEGKLTLLLGDVTGKGASAALAVAAIMTVLYEQRERGAGLDVCLVTLHETLRGMFRGHLLSTVTALEANAPGDVRYLSVGASGWLHTGAGQPRFLSTKGHLLGSDEPFTFAWGAVQLEPGQALVAVTDGFIDGSHRQRLWLKRLSALGLAGYDFARIHALCDGLRREFDIEDDRTIVGLEYKGDGGATANRNVAG